MKKSVVIFIFLLIAVIAGFSAWHLSHLPVESLPPEEQTPQPYEVSTENVVLTEPLGNASVSSPLEISGRAKGTWFFEASFPAQVLDEDGTVLGVMPMHADGDWMTQDFVPFSGTIVFNTPKGTKGTLVLKKDNPSGLPENEAEVRVPIFFSQVTSQQPQGTCAPGLACTDPATTIN